MKTTMLIITICAVTLCTELLFAAKPEQLTKQQAANLTVNKIKRDIQLTDSQSILIKKYAEDYYEGATDANLLQNRQEMLNKKIDLYKIYQTKCDSILLVEQRELLKTKNNERKDNTHKKTKN